MTLDKERLTAALTAAGFHGLTFHRNGCTRRIGPRGGVTETVIAYRDNGAIKTWKREPSRFSLPIKYGFRGPHGYITESNASEFHLAGDCPLLATEGAIGG